MNITKFLLIDAALVIAAIPLLFMIHGGIKNSLLFRSPQTEELLGKTSIKLPDKGKLLELERIAMNQGSGIELNSLFGNWKFVSVWKKDTDEEDSIFSWLLRVFSAKLKLKKDISIKNPLKFSIKASIQFGILSIEFSGNGYLRGEQPFLPFLFNLIELKSGSTILFSRCLEEALEKEQSFFALIALGESCRWLSARGQGGALILWLKE
tara:strand:- start:438 stop:1064 length:627 start_codon:yes stop_codon:yes gene_type:complete